VTPLYRRSGRAVQVESSFTHSLKAPGFNT
jgi:hypothetical protein